MASEAELKLRAALELLQETSEQTSDIQGISETNQALQTSRFTSAGDAWQTIQANRRFWGAIGALRGSIDQAMELANEAERIDRDCRIVEEDVEVTPATVRASGCSSMACYRTPMIWVGMPSSISPVHSGRRRVPQPSCSLVTPWQCRGSVKRLCAL